MPKASFVGMGEGRPSLALDDQRALHASVVVVGDGAVINAFAGSIRGGEVKVPDWPGGNGSLELGFAGG